MLLAIDVGNTNIVVGGYRGAERVVTGRFEANRSATPESLWEDIVPLLSSSGIPHTEITEVAIASVVPPLEAALQQCCEQFLALSPFFVRSEIECGIRLHYSPPASLGVDRLCNVVGCIEKYGAPAIVIDFGTATKLEAIAENGDYLGGVILPGIGISVQALLARASRLFEIEWRIPEHVIGQSSVEAMQSGFVFGFAGQAEALIQRFREEIGCRAQVVATGGLAPQIVPACPSIEILAPWLTLDGLRSLYYRQKT